MKRYMRFLPIMLAALALAASGSNMILRNASAQLGGTQPGRQKGGGGGAATLSVAAQQQIRALLDDKYKRTPVQRKISSHLLNAMRVQRGEKMTSDGSVGSLTSAMSIAKSAMSASKDDRPQALVNIRAAATKQLMMEIETLGGQVKLTSEKAEMIRALIPLDMLEVLASNPAVKRISSADLEKTRNRQVTVSKVLNGSATPFGRDGVRHDSKKRPKSVRHQLHGAPRNARQGTKPQLPLANV